MAEVERQVSAIPVLTWREVVDLIDKVIPFFTYIGERDIINTLTRYASYNYQALCFFRGRTVEDYCKRYTEPSCYNREPDVRRLLKYLIKLILPLRSVLVRAYTCLSQYQEVPDVKRFTEETGLTLEMISPVIEMLRIVIDDVETEDARILAFTTHPQTDQEPEDNTAYHGSVWMTVKDDFSVHMVDRYDSCSGGYQESGEVWPVPLCDISNKWQSRMKEPPPIHEVCKWCLLMSIVHYRVLGSPQDRAYVIMLGEEPYNGI